ncbi:FAD-binding oxidoreductase, partial [bacterium]|nr:FAD-binding oxidoreductase [bacterium]
MPLQTDYLTPPVLTSAHIGHTVLCHRPVRALMPAMTAGRFGTQIIACNYGHAGFGWIMAPGSTGFVLDQMTTLVNAQAKKQAITIVGAGIMGLMAAYQLLQRGYHDITVVAQGHTHLTSHKAVGFFSPTIELGKSWITQDIKTIVRASYAFYQDILAGRQPDFAPSSLLQLPMYTAKPNLNGIILSPSPAQRVIIDFGTGAAHEVIKQEGGLLIHVNV